MADYRRLRAWQAARVLTSRVYRVTEGFPRSERYGLSSQMRRAAVSIVANIAEGAGRGSEGEFTRFLWVARGSVTELTAEIGIASDLGYLERDQGGQLADAANEVGRLLTGLLRSRGATSGRGPPHTPQATNDQRLTTND